MTRRSRFDDWDSWEPPDENSLVEAERLAEELQDAGAGADADASKPYVDVEGEGDSGASWLSNAVVIGSIPDDKLRSTLARYKSLVRLCETELAARALLPKRRDKSDKYVSFVDQYAPNKRPKKDNPVRQASTRRQSRRLTPKALKPDQLVKALEMLIQLKQKRDTK